MLKIRLTLITTIILFVLNACKKDEATTNTNPQRLQKIIYSEGDSILYTFFNYDENNKLIFLVDSNNNGHFWQTFIQYNLQSQPMKIKVLYRNSPGASFIEWSDSLIYNSDQKVIKKFLNSYPSNTYKIQNTYGYDVQGRLLADTMYNYGSGDVYGYTRFIYDGNDDITQWQSYNNSSGTMQAGSVIIATYNSSINPYNALGLLTYFIREENSLLSGHNYLQVKYYDGTTVDYSYQYYNNGLPEKVVLMDNRGGPFSTRTIEFFYD
jgi:hypothetical protein